MKSYRIEAADTNGAWRTVYRERANSQRLVRVPLHVEATALRFVAEETWGDPQVRLFNFEPLDKFDGKIPEIAEGPTFTEVRAKIAPEDLAPPEGVLDDGKKSKLGRLSLVGNWSLSSSD